MSECFPKPCNIFGGDISLKLDLSNYLTKADLKGARGVNMSNLAAKSDLASLKAEVDKIDVNKLKNVPVDLSKVSNVLNNDVVKKTVYEKLVAKVNATYTSGFVLKTKYDRYNQVSKRNSMTLTKKYLILVELLKNAKISEIEGKIPSISGLAITAVLTAFENKIPNVSYLVKKADYDAKYQTLKVNISFCLIITNLRVIYLMQR